MKTKLSVRNPFGPNAKGYLWETLSKNPVDNFLDFGANNGNMLCALSVGGCFSSAIGVDLNKELLEESMKKMPSNVELKVTYKNQKLPFEDNYFCAVSAIGVLEHIYDQQSVLRELHRVIVDNGKLFIAIPGKHLFSFLDMGNFKFVFPRIHKWFYIKLNSEEVYNKRYLECKNGMFGDIETEKGWHEHFSRKEIACLLGRHGFKIENIDGAGFFMRVIRNLLFFLPEPIKGILKKIDLIDSKVFSSAELFLVARKCDLSS